MYNYSSSLRKEFEENAKLINDEIKPFSYKTKEPVRCLIHWIKNGIEVDYRFDQPNILTFVYEIKTPTDMENLLNNSEHILSSYDLHVEISKGNYCINEVIKSFEKNPYQWCVIEPVENMTNKENYLLGLASLISRTDDDFLEKYGIKSTTDVVISITEPTIQEKELQIKYMDYVKELESTLDFITSIPEL